MQEGKRVLASATPYMKTETTKLIFFSSQFNYYPLVWMLHNHQNNINKHLRERCLWQICNDKLLQKNGSFSSNHKNI